MYKNVKEIKDALVNDGWSPSIQLEEVPETELNKKFFGTLDTRNHKFFRMLFSGNIYNDNGKVIYFNVPVISV